MSRDQWVVVECKDNRPTFVSVPYGDFDRAVADVLENAADSGYDKEPPDELRRRLEEESCYEDGDVTISIHGLGG